MNRSFAREFVDGAPAPTVSVVLPTRNRARLLDRAISSVLRQSVGDLELIVVDDGSTDDTASVLAACQARDSRVRAIRPDPAGRGASAARNAGIAAARGEFVAFLDDDAEWAPRKLERQLEAIREGGAGVVYCRFARVAADGRARPIGSGAAARGDPWRALLARAFIDTSTLLVRSTALRAVGGFDEDLPRLQDWDLALRLARVCRFAYVPEVLARTYETPGSISSRTDALEAACERIASKVAASGATDAELASLLRALGHALVTSGSAGNGRRFLARAWRLQPFSVTGAAMLFLAVCGSTAYRAADAVRLAIGSRWSERS